MISGIYAWDLKDIICIMAAGLGIWSILSAAFQKKHWWFACNIVLLVISVYGILRYTVFGRTSSGFHEFVLLAPFSDEFWREMLMNIFLFFPLGLSLGNVLKSYFYICFIGTIFSLAIEGWQFLAGTGLAQGSDVFCNGIGVAIGALVVMFGKLCRNLPKYGKKVRGLSDN